MRGGGGEGYKKLSNHELEILHQEAQRFVTRFADSNNPSFAIVALTESTEGQQALSCRTRGVNRMRLRDFIFELDKEFPGSDVMIETQSSPVNMYLEFPILQTISYDKEVLPERTIRGSVSFLRKPSTEYGMFLLMIEIISIIVLYFRIVYGKF